MTSRGPAWDLMVKPGGLPSSEGRLRGFARLCPLPAVPISAHRRREGGGGHRVAFTLSKGPNCSNWRMARGRATGLESAAWMVLMAALTALPLQVAPTQNKRFAVAARPETRAGICSISRSHHAPESTNQPSTQWRGNVTTFEQLSRR